MDNIDNNNNNNNSANKEENELFNHILNHDENNINIFLSRKKYPIYDFKNIDEYKSTLLHLSVCNHNFNIVKTLIDYCKNNYPDKLNQFINSEDIRGICPIHYASFTGNLDIIKLLIENGADITKKTQKKMNIIHYCAQGNRPNSLIYFYLKFRENKKEKNKVKYKLFFEKDEDGFTVLHWAVYLWSEEFLMYLINLDIFDSEQEKLNFINMPSKNGNTALHLLPASRICIKLLQNGADPSKRDVKGRSPLDLAINGNHQYIIDVFKDAEKCQLFRLKLPLKKVKRNYKNIIFIFASQIVSQVILIISTLPIIFYKYEDNEYINALFGLFLFFLIIFIIFYILLLIVDPGVKRSRNLEELQSLLKNNVDLRNYCYKCYILLTDTSKHCIICDCCYDNFDHHCYWINKCVAKNNFVLFIFFLNITFLYLLISFILVIFGLINTNIFNSDDFDSSKFCQKHFLFKSFNSIEPCLSIYNNKFIFHYVLNIILTLIILAFLIPEFYLLFFNLKVYISNCRDEKKKKQSAIKISTSPLIDEKDESFYISLND